MSPPRVSLSPSNLSATLICDVLVNASVICSPNLSSKISSPRRLTSMKKDFASVSEIQKESCTDQGIRGEIAEAEECVSFKNIVNKVFHPLHRKSPYLLKTLEAVANKCPEANAGKGLSQFQTMWTIKKEDLALKEKLGKIKLLNTLLAREGPLAASEETLKEQLITELRP
ncbi:hypothetical protein YC2023_105299 [Brassica napus]